MGLPPVVAGLFVYLLLSRSGPLGSLGLLFTPTAMVIAQVVLVTPIIAAIARQMLEDLWPYRFTATEPADWRRHAILLLQRREIDNLAPQSLRPLRPSASSPTAATPAVVLSNRSSSGTATKPRRQSPGSTASRYPRRG